ncbi:MAG TPA: hypothetical protein VFG59_12960 [Anaeromyxobacter sp.]|nr:hypothetical protein [Anaeromyxobacter sp.]
MAKLERLEQQFPLAVVVEPAQGFGPRKPGDLVDLVECLERALLHELHVPEKDDLRGPPGHVVYAPGKGDDSRAAARLLEDLAQGRLLPVLTVLELPLGEAPVLPVRPVDDRHAAAAVAADTPDEPAGGPDDRHGQILASEGDGAKRGVLEAASGLSDERLLPPAVKPGSEKV